MNCHVSPPPTRRSSAIACLLAAVLLAGCGSTNPTPVPSPARSATAAPAVTPGATASPSPAASPTSSALAPGSLVVTVSDRVRVRSEPRVTDDSIKYQPLLPTGTELLVIEGPVQASGYDWYRVAPTSLTLSDGVTDGWVAVADHDGTPWVAHAEGPLTWIEFARATVTRAPGTGRAARQAATMVNAFALDLYRRMRTEPTLDLDGRNVVFSPTSIALALAMARAGARADTASEMDAVLGAAGWDELSAALSSLEQDLAGHNATWKGNDKQTQSLALRIANAAFAQRDWEIEQAYLDRIAGAFGAGLGLVDYIADPDAAREEVNAWVSRQTAGRIPSLLAQPNVTRDTRLILVNAIYLKAAWLVAFGSSPWEEDATRDRGFTLPDGSAIRVPTMGLWGEQDVPYATGKGWQATDLRYLGAEGTTPLAMTLILPDDLVAFEKDLTAARVEAIVTRLDRQRGALQEATYQSGDDCGTYPYSVKLFMPRWGIDTKGDLAPVLAAMGMPSAFEAGVADFSRITPADPLLHISAVIHQANIDVDEKGTEAAAATAVIMDTGGCTGPDPAKSITFRLNRPFLFLLRDVETGAILFMGRVLDPSVRG